MAKYKFPYDVVIRNLLGFVALVGAHFIGDRYHFFNRAGFQQASPYLFLLSLYGWIAFHNRVLFERVYLKVNRLAYAGWTLSIMLIGSINMHLVLTFSFNLAYTLPHILSFWIYTCAGFGVYILYKNLFIKKKLPAYNGTDQPAINLTISANGKQHVLDINEIRYVESLENYVKIFTGNKNYLVRLSMKQAEEKFPKPAFVRISRSHIVNALHVTAIESNILTLGYKVFKIGNVYKRYVEEQFNQRQVSGKTANDL